MPMLMKKYFTVMKSFLPSIAKLVNVGKVLYNLHCHEAPPQEENTKN